MVTAEGVEHLVERGLQMQRARERLTQIEQRRELLDFLAAADLEAVLQPADFT